MIQHSAKNKVYTAVEFPCEPEGGYEKFYQFIGMVSDTQQMREGEALKVKSLVPFIVEPDGSVTNIGVVRGVSEDLDQEAVRVISISPKWRSGIQDGKFVRQSLVIPITFKLAGRR
ncbi:MAG: TonB family protein [Cyclobacteriaceae bacterium]